MVTAFFTIDLTSLGKLTHGYKRALMTIKQVKLTVILRYVSDKMVNPMSEDVPTPEPSVN